MSKLAYSYVRFSSPPQARGRSKARQIELCKAYCQKHGLTLADGAESTFYDEGKSAYKGHHLGEKGQLARFIRMVKDEEIARGSVLIIESLDRLSREEITIAQGTLSTLLNLGIEVVTLTDEKVYRQGGGPLDIIMSVLILARAHEESSIKSGRLRDSYVKKHKRALDEKQPMGHAVPLWIKLSLDKQSFNLIPERVEVVRRIFRMSIDGLGRNRTALTLNADGIPAFKGGTWATTSVGKILKNRAVLGEYQRYSIFIRDNGERVMDSEPAPKGSIRKPYGPPIPDYYPQIVSEEDFVLAQNRIEDRKTFKATKPAANVNLWQGIAKCAICGEAMHLINKGRPPKGDKYLRCYAAKKGNCSGGFVRLDGAELVFKSLLGTLNASPLIRDESKKIQRQLDVVIARQAAADLKLMQIADLLARDDTASATLASQANKTEAEISDLLKQVTVLKNELAKQKVTNKEEFFRLLDLESSDGRARANAFVRGVGIKVYVAEGFSVTQLTERGQLARQEIQEYHELPRPPDDVLNDSTQVERLISQFVLRDKQVTYQHIESYDEYKTYAGATQHLLDKVNQHERTWKVHVVEHFQ